MRKCVRFALTGLGVSYRDRPLRNAGRRLTQTDAIQRQKRYPFHQ